MFAQYRRDIGREVFEVLIIVRPENLIFKRSLQPEFRVKIVMGRDLQIAYYPEDPAFGRCLFGVTAGRTDTACFPLMIIYLSYRFPTAGRTYDPYFSAKILKPLILIVKAYFIHNFTGFQ